MSLRILNWNTQADRHRVGSDKLRAIRERVACYNADIICLTEAYPEAMPDGGRAICSEVSGWGYPEKRGARKVVLWSKQPWSDIDTQVDSELPEGRFIKANTLIEGEQWTIVGMCIPWHDYRRNESKWGDLARARWQGACDYLDALRCDILPKPRKRKRTILIGDFNLQIPAFNYPSKRSEVNQKRKATFDGWLIPTSGIRKHFVDHIAMSADLYVASLRFISKQAEDGSPLSDHNGAVLDIALD